MSERAPTVKVLDNGSYYWRGGHRVPFVSPATMKSEVRLLDGSGGPLPPGAEAVYLEVTWRLIHLGLARNSAGQLYTSTSERQ